MKNTNKTVNGLTIIKSGRKIVAKIYDRAIFYPANGIKSSFGEYPFSVEVPMFGGAFTCKTINEVNEILLKYNLN